MEHDQNYIFNKIRISRIYDKRNSPLKIPFIYDIYYTYLQDNTPFMEKSDLRGISRGP